MPYPPSPGGREFLVLSSLPWREGVRGRGSKAPLIPRVSTLGGHFQALSQLSHYPWGGPSIHPAPERAGHSGRTVSNPNYPLFTIPLSTTPASPSPRPSPVEGEGVSHPSIGERELEGVLVLPPLAGASYRGRLSCPPSPGGRELEGGGAKAPPHPQSLYFGRTLPSSLPTIPLPLGRPFDTPRPGAGGALRANGLQSQLSTIHYPTIHYSSITLTPAPVSTTGQALSRRGRGGRLWNHPGPRIGYGQVLSR